MNAYRADPERSRDSGERARDGPPARSDSDDGPDGGDSRGSRRSQDRGDGHPSRTNGKRGGTTQPVGQSPQVAAREPGDGGYPASTGDGHTGASSSERAEDSDPGDHRVAGTDSDDALGIADGRVSRRQLLGGGAGLAIAAIGGWFYVSGGPEGARAVASEYVRAVAENDWEAARRTFHPDSDVITRIEADNEIDDYEDSLAAEKRLDRLTEIEPEIDGIYEYEHVPQPEPDVEEVIYRAPPDVDRFAAWKHVVVVVTVDVDAWYSDPNRSDRAEHYEEGETKELVSAGTVNDGGEWHLWNAVL